MTTDAMMTTEPMMYEDVTDKSPIISGSKMCLSSLDLPLLARIILYTLSSIFCVCHLLVIIVCVRERKKATYKHDIVYMVGLAIVDMTFLLSAVMSRPSVRNTGALRGLMPLLLFMSVMLLATRAVDRFNIFIRKQAKPWSLRFQIVLCLISNIFVTVPITYFHMYTDIPFGFIFWCIVSLIIMIFYSTIMCKILLKARKSIIRISLTHPSRLFRCHLAKGQSSMGTTTDENAGTSSTNKTEMTLVKTLETPNAATNRHSSVQPDHVGEEKTLDQVTNIEVIPAETSNQMRKKHKVMDTATSSNPIGKENKEPDMAIAITDNHIKRENAEADIATTGNRIAKENAGVDIVKTSNHIGKKDGEVAIATSNNYVRKENEEVDIVHTSKHMGNESKELFFVKTNNYPRMEKKEEYFVLNSTQWANRNKNVLPVQKSEKFGKEKIGVRLKVGQNSAHMGKDRKTEVPVHVNRNQRLITKQNKGNHIRSASLALVFSTIISYLSWFPTWLIDIWDGAPCYLLMFIYVNNIVNPFVYLITPKTFRQASNNLISSFFLENL